jgi:mRNA-degrading endonuclease toxin of MazEF toxin-antitoxin module
MRGDCVVNADDLHTIHKANILNRITELSPERMDEIALAIGYALDLPIDL